MPFDKRKPFDPSGIRLGTAAVTTRGLTTAHMPLIAGWIDDAVKAASANDTATIERIRAQVNELTAGFPMPGFA